MCAGGSPVASPRTIPMSWTVNCREPPEPLSGRCPDLEGSQPGRDVVACETPQCQGVKDLVEPEPPRRGVRPLGAIDRRAQGVQQPADDDQCDDGRTAVAPERGQPEDRGPAQRDVQRD